METKQAYLHAGQRYLAEISAKNEFVIAPRGWGKSEGIDAIRLVRNVFAMPRSSGGLLSPSYAKLLQNTLPAVASAINRMFGFIRDVHYVIGRKPPQAWNWPKPINEPFSYDHVMTWFNGSILYLISFDRPMSANSMSLDYILGFEAKFLPIDKVKDEVYPAVRGNRQFFGNCPWHLGKTFTTDMPMLKSGQWIHDEEKNMDPKLIDAIRHLNYERVRFYNDAGQLDAKYLRQSIAKVERELSAFRSRATLYKECNPFDSLHIHGPGWWGEKKREVSPFIFEVSFLNKRARRVPNGFYASLDAKMHYYQATNYHHADKMDWGYAELNPNSCLLDGDMNPGRSLHIAMDYNASICNLVVGQLDEVGDMNTINHLYVKTPRKIRDLVSDFCHYYQDKPLKDVVFYYDHTAVADTPGDSESFYQIVMSELRHHRWNAKEVYIGLAPAHKDKHAWIDDALKGNAGRFPRFNQERCENLLAAMEQTGAKVGHKGFQKDKSAEKKADSPDAPDERKTHATDAWDTLFVGMNYFYVEGPGGGSMATHFG